MARVLLDESIPRHVGPALEGHEVETVPGLGWAGVANGELLRRAAEQFDVLVTGDQSLQHQQNLSQIDLGLLVVAARDNRVETMLRLVPRILGALNEIRPGTVQVIAA